MLIRMRGIQAAWFNDQAVELLAVELCFNHTV